MKQIKSNMSNLINKINALKKYQIFILLFLLFALFTLLQNWMFGLDIKSGSKVNYIVETALFFILIHNLNRKLCAYILFFSGIFGLLYFPIGRLYGIFNVGLLVSVLYTDSNEAIEFIKNIPVLLWIKGFLISCIIWVVAFLSLKINSVELTKKNCYIFMLIIVIFIVQTAIKHKGDKVSIRIVPLNFLGETIKAYLVFKDNYVWDKNDIKNSWHITGLDQQYEDYVLIIGESMAANYLSLYGYPIENTPFLEKRANIIMDKVISAGANTPMALHNELFLIQDNQKKISHTIVTLANSANMTVFWFSNQGDQTSKWSTPATAVGKQARESHFSKTISKGDLSLLPLLEKAVKQQPIEIKTKDNKLKKQKRLFILHLYGSHSDACERLIDLPPPKYTQHNYTNCYIQSIKNTDAMIEHIYNTMKKYSQSFTIFYLSDHGQARTHDRNGNIEKDYIINHTDQFIEGYHVPLVIINDKDDTQKRICNIKSGIHIINGFAQWLGIQTKETAGYDFFANQDDKSVKVLDFNNNLKNANTLKSEYHGFDWFNACYPFTNNEVDNIKIK